MSTFHHGKKMYCMYCTGREDLWHKTALRPVSEMAVDFFFTRNSIKREKDKKLLNDLNESTKKCKMSTRKET